MILSAFLLLLSTVEPEVRTETPTYRSTEPAFVEMFAAIPLERAIDEFMSVCFAPDLRTPKVLDSVSQSSLGYDAPETGGVAGSFDWRSLATTVALRVSSDMSQCVVGAGLTEDYTRHQVMAVLQPRIESALNRQLEAQQDGVFLEWKAAASRDIKRITVILPDDRPDRVLTITFDRTAPGIREALERSIRR